MAINRITGALSGQEARDAAYHREKRSKSGPSENTIDELIGPVCMIAELVPTTAWPKELISLITAARNVKALYGLHTETMPTSD